MTKKELEQKVKEGADLEGAYLRGADLEGANLGGANLDVKTPPQTDHYFISEILFRESKTFKQRSFAGCVRISYDWCWNEFIEESPKTMIVWARKILCDKWPESFTDKFAINKIGNKEPTLE